MNQRYPGVFRSRDTSPPGGVQACSGAAPGHIDYGWVERFDQVKLERLKANMERHWYSRLWGMIFDSRREASD